MSRLKELIGEIHRRSLWQVLAIYVVASWVVFEVVQTVTEGLGLPQWLPSFAALLLLIGLPIVLATAFVQEGGPPLGRTDPTLLPGAEVEPEAAPRRAQGVRRLFTWRNAIMGGALAFGLWGVVATGWLFFGDRGDQDSTEAAAVVERKSVAVLPFVNLSADPANEYFSDGITDDIITHLSKLAELKVISRTSVMRYKETDKSLSQIAGELGVATILEGGVQRVGDRVRINAQLINAATDEHLWAEQYNRRLTDVFEIQTDVALQIAAALQARLSPEERGRVERRPTENLAAYNLYLQGRYFWNKRTPEGLQIAIDYFEGALEIDPDYAPAWVGLADSYTISADWGYLSPGETYEKAKSAALKALEIDETLGEAHIARANIHQGFEWDMEGARAEYLRGIALSPGYATGHQWYGRQLTQLGLYGEAMRALERAVELDPLSLIINLSLGSGLRIAGEHERSMRQLEKAQRLDPNFAGPYQEIGYTYEDMAALEDAINSYQRALDLSDKLIGIGELGHVYGAMGLTEKALEMLRELEQEANRRYVSPIEFAIIHAGLGEKDVAFEWIDRGLDEGDATLLWRLDTPGFKELRSDPRFTQLQRRLGLRD
jgi:TolB-like protein